MTDTVVVTGTGGTIMVLGVPSAATPVIQVSTPGPQGPAGPPGSTSGDLHYTHTQSTPLAVWVIDHGLGKFPSVTVVDSSGSECEGDVSYPSLNQVVVTFCAAFGGKAFLN